VGCAGEEVGIIATLDRPDADAPKVEVVCPYCASHDTEFFSLFGQQLLTVQYYCNACHTPFEYVKDDDMLNTYATRKESQE
jgi:DNA-directed RNA polymerase subunit RPC12/RpoP